jgi:hypothetical protein
MRDLAALQLRTKVAAPSRSAPQLAGERLDWSEEVATTWGDITELTEPRNFRTPKNSRKFLEPKIGSKTKPRSTGLEPVRVTPLDF